jgi:hypothetical protein
VHAIQEVRVALAWLLFGAFFGAVAGMKRGFSPIIGLAGGALLGIFAPLLFFVSGIASRGDIDSKTCPHCAERVKPEARLCKHCHQPLVTEPNP